MISIPMPWPGKTSDWERRSRPKKRQRQLRGFPDSELKLLRTLPTGSRLEQGATYIDLRNLEVGESTATGEMHAGPNNWIVAKKEVPYELWKRLRGEEQTQSIE